MLPGIIATLGAFAGISSPPIPGLFNIGGTSDDSTGSVILSGVSVPAGALIVVLAGEQQNFGTTGTVTDGAGNTYTKVSVIKLPNASNNSSYSAYYAANVVALNAQSITYTKNISGVDAVMTAFYWTGAAASSPLDTAVTATAIATTTVTSGTPAVANELFVGWVCTNVNVFTAYSQSGGGFTTPPTLINDAGARASIAGGSVINTGTGTITFAPTASAGTHGVQILGFKP